MKTLAAQGTTPAGNAPGKFAACVRAAIAAGARLMREMKL